MSNNRNQKNIVQRDNLFRTINNFNATTKVLLLVLYTFILVGGTFLITSAINNKRMDRIYKGYETVTEDENIYLNLRLSEMRNINSSNNEEARYSIFGVVYQKTDVTADIIIKKIEYSIYTNDEKIIFDERGDNNKLSKRYTFNFSTLYKKVADKTNQAPHTIYLKVMYNIKTEGENKIDKQLLIKEVIDYKDPIDKNYQLHTLEDDGKINNNFFSTTLSKRAPSSDDKEGRIKTEFRSKENGLIKHVKYQSYISVDNHESDPDEFIANYFILVNYYGSFNPDIFYSTYNDFNNQEIPAVYKPKFLYINAEIEAYDGEIHKFNYKVDLAEIPVK